MWFIWTIVWETAAAADFKFWLFNQFYNIQLFTFKQLSLVMKACVLGHTARLYFTLRSIVQLLWVNLRLYLTLKVDVIYVKSTRIELKKWLILKFEFPALDCDWSIQIFDLKYLRVYKNNDNFLMSFLYCIDLIILSQTPFNKDINLIKVNNIKKQSYHILCVF